MKYLYSILLIAGILTSCDNKIQVNEEFVSKSIDINEFMDNFIYKIDFIPLETSRESLIGNIIKVINTDDYFFILHEVGNDKMLSQYDSSGKFIGHIGAKGRADNEYLNINDFAVSSNIQKIFIFDSSPKVIVYNYEGKYHSTISIQEPTLKNLAPFICDSEIMDDGRVVLGFAPNYRSETEFCISNLCFDTIDVLSQGNLKMQYGAFIGSRNIIACNYNNIYALKPLSTTVIMHCEDKQKNICINNKIQNEITELSHNSNFFNDFYPKVLVKPYIRSLFSMGKYCLAHSLMDMYLFSDNTIVSVDCRDNKNIDFPILPGAIVWSDRDQIITTTTPQHIKNFLESVEGNSSLKEQLDNIRNVLNDDSNPILIRYNIKDKEF